MTLRLVAGGALDREALEPSTGVVTCDCGEAWFRPVGLGDQQVGAISFQADGRIAGIAGALECIGCGKQMLPGA